MVKMQLNIAAKMLKEDQVCVLLNVKFGSLYMIFKSQCSETCVLDALTSPHPIFKWLKLETL